MMPSKAMTVLKTAASEANLASLKEELDRCTDTFKEVVVSGSDSTPASTVGASQVESHSPVTPGNRTNGNTHVALCKEGVSGGSIIANGHIDDDEVDKLPVPGAPTKRDPFIAKNARRVFQPRKDRDVNTITSESAQGVLPPNACVFVANLLASADDADLDRAVLEAFSDYGECWVKVRRDGRGMPYAFVQYREVHQSEKAILAGRGRLVLSRPCRTERAKAARALYLSTYTGAVITVPEAHDILAGYGDIENVWYASHTDREMFRLPEGIWIQFAYFNDARDAQAEFRQSSLYRLEQPSLPEEFRSRLEHHHHHRPAKNGIVSGLFANKAAAAGRQSRWSPTPSRPRSVHRPRVWTLSVFVGNLPYRCEASDVKDFFEQHGPVISVQLVVRDVKSHAFVEFEHQTGYQNALGMDHWFRGRLLHVEPRLSVPLVSLPDGDVPQNDPRFARLIPCPLSAMSHVNRNQSHYGPYAMPGQQGPMYGGPGGQAFVAGPALPAPHYGGQQIIPYLVPMNLPAPAAQSGPQQPPQQQQQHP